MDTVCGCDSSKPSHRLLHIGNSEPYERGPGLFSCAQIWDANQEYDRALADYGEAIRLSHLRYRHLSRVAMS